MKHRLIKSGMYLGLIIGLVIALVSVILAVMVFINYPEASLSKKAISAAAFLIGGAVIGLISIAAYETVIEIEKLEEEVFELEQEARER